ncbi:MAG TPA: hypothetical protein VE129_20960 [Thermoanaerobaculia bacterium]|nr:hypothetical protein [Thermoanaerobaculia bacterium]
MFVGIAMTSRSRVAKLGSTPPAISPAGAGGAASAAFSRVA